MIEQEFFGVDQRPDQVLEVLAGCLLSIDWIPFGIETRFGDVVQRRLHLFRARLPRKGREVQLANFRFNGSVLLRQSLGAPAGTGELRLDFRRIDEVQALRETRGLNALALADALAFRPAKDPQKWRRLIVAVVRK